MKTPHEKATEIITNLKQAIKDMDKQKILDLISPDQEERENYPNWDEIEAEIADEYETLIDQGLDIIL